MRLRHSGLLRFAPLGVALAMGGATANAQNVISRQVTEEPVETIVTQTPTGTVITRRPLAPAVAPALAPVPAWTPSPVAIEPARETVQVRRYETYRPAPAVRSTRATFVDETVGAAPAERTVTRRFSTPPRVSRTTRSLQRTTTVQRTVRRVAAGPLVLDPGQRRIVYRTIVQQQVVPSAPVYPRAGVIPATTGYGYAVPPDADDDDVYVEREVAPAVYPVRYTVGSQLPAGVMLAPLPAAVALQVPSIRPYAYARIGGRILLVDPATYTVVADITP